MENLIIKELCGKCIKEGKALLNTKWLHDNIGGMPMLNPKAYVDLEGFNKWKSNCSVLQNMLGELSKPWDDVLNRSKGNSLVSVKNILGAISSMLETIDAGYLVKIESLIFAEAFSNLLEQAEHLAAHGYLIAAGVLGRAVLEERLRKMVEENSIPLSKNRPTLSDLNTALYKSTVYSKIEYKNIDHLTSIGNNAAHNLSLSKTDVQDLLRGVTAFLNKYQ